MKLRDLSYLLALEKTEHFGKAAELSHVSQPTLSVQLKKLEDSLGLILVERNNKHVQLTPAGKAIAEKAKAVFMEIQAIKSYAASQQDPYAGDIQVGIIPTLAPYLLPHITGPLVEAFPQLSLWLHEDKTDILLKNIEKGELDLAIISLPIKNEGLITIPLFTEPFILASFHENHIANQNSVCLNDLTQEKIMLLTEGHCFSEQSLALCSQAAISPINFRGSTLETLRNMVAVNMGSTLMPALAAMQTHPLLKYIPFADPKPSRELAFVYRHTHVRSQLFEAMADVIRRHIPL